MCFISKREPLTIFEQEERVLAFSGLKLHKELFVYDVNIQIQGKLYKIHTYRCGDGNSESMVLIHGYAGGSFLYYQMLKDLSKRFRVYCMDIVGMGLSSREEFTCKSTEETLGFFMESIEKWREAVGLTKFHLVGHSLGAYLSGYYTAKYQQYVTKLTLLSPAGITQYNKEPTPQELRERLGFFKNLSYGIVMKVIEITHTPSMLIKNHPVLGKFLINYYVSMNFCVKGAEAEALKDLMFSILNLPEGTADSIYFLLKPPTGFAYIPLEQYIAHSIKVPVDCLFGEEDTMDMIGAKRIQDEKKRSKFGFNIVPKAAHQLPLQNPKFVSDHILQDKLSTEEC